jgi:glycerophosphoryl diester phosphodiesterase
MKILAHRGFWTAAAEKNTWSAFERALQDGFGIETDLRDADGQIVIAHDLPRGDEISLDQFLQLCARYPQGRPLALNIKADGLQALVRDTLARHAIDDAFVFDMAVPDALGYLRQQIPTYTRCSEYEPAPAYLAQAAGIWLDAFHSEWYAPQHIEQFLQHGKAVCLVSPELHRRPHLALWRQLRDSGLHQHPLFSLCTDFPSEAKDYFSAQD